MTGLCGRSWSAVKAYVEGFGPLSGPLGAVLGILAALGASVGGLGSLTDGVSAGGLGSLGGHLWAILGRYRGSVGGLGSLSGPLLTQSGAGSDKKAILRRNLAEK